MQWRHAISADARSLPSPTSPSKYHDTPSSHTKCTTLHRHSLQNACRHPLEKRVRCDVIVVTMSEVSPHIARLRFVPDGTLQAEVPQIVNLVGDGDEQSSPQNARCYIIILGYMKVLVPQFLNHIAPQNALHHHQTFYFIRSRNSIRVHTQGYGTVPQQWVHWWWKGAYV